jgi:hypothetical protein
MIGRHDVFVDNNDGTYTRRRYVNDRLVEVTHFHKKGIRGAPLFHRSIVDRIAHVTHVTPKQYGSWR